MPKQVTRRPMSIPVLVFHWTMMIGTGGLWTPVYLAGRRKRKMVTSPAG